MKFKIKARVYPSFKQILEGKKHFWDIKFKIKARVYPSFKQHLITFLGQSGHFGIFGIFYALD
ncbi:hypothetical protein F9665_08860 [Campylobacter jejuni]|nr:hypothetical protein [Campylobacter jejuni]